MNQILALQRVDREIDYKGITNVNANHIVQLTEYQREQWRQFFIPSGRTFEPMNPTMRKYTVQDLRNMERKQRILEARKRKAGKQ